MGNTEFGKKSNRISVKNKADFIGPWLCILWSFLVYTSCCFHFVPVGFRAGGVWLKVELKFRLGFSAKVLGVSCASYVGERLAPNTDWLCLMEWLESVFAGLIRRQIRGQLECMAQAEQKTTLTQYLSKARWQFGDLRTVCQTTLIICDGLLSWSSSAHVISVQVCILFKNEVQTLHVDALRIQMHINDQAKVCSLFPCY